MDAMERVHQCATIQLDFMHPIRFNLRYKTASDNAENFERPVMIHRAMLGSVERMAAVLIEHFGGKWPFWLSPRQVLVVPVKDSVNDYAQEVGAAVHKAGYYVETELSGDTMQKKVRNGQLSQFNYILVVGEKEKTDKTVNVRLRNNEVKGVVSLDGLFAMFQEHIDKYE
uniref:Threonyl-tRNA synthetase n=2 Tax=Octactis speculum TaxID=3111310 RepID=A0A7S2B6W9_9STRA|mmetsp:Transcript_20162/g.27408  ORF Transcript_20162/g.27408 Transcript_20162/m.27408 type:complete len:170 (+) Transcript_20162:67-576(+)